MDPRTKCFGPWRRVGEANLEAKGKGTKCDEEISAVMPILAKVSVVVFTKGKFDFVVMLIMAPTRKSRSVNRRYFNEVSPSNDGDSAKRGTGKKRKLSDMLGSRWSLEELTRFYDAFRKYGKEWKKVAGAVRNRSPEMVEAIYSMNRAYLSLPHGTASAAGLIAMMTDHYSNLAGSGSDKERNDGAGSSRKTQKRARGKVQSTTSKAPDDQFVSPVASDYGFLSSLKKKRSGGTRPCPVGKRTPRFPVAFTYENANGDKYVSPTKQGLKLKASANDDEVAHEIAIALAEASQRGGSPPISRTPNRRPERVMSSPFRHVRRKHSLEEEDLEGSAEANTGELSRHNPSMIRSLGLDTLRKKAGKPEGKKFEVDNDSDNHLDDTNEECSGTEEDKMFSASRGKLDVDATDAKISRSSIRSQKKKSKKVLFTRDEAPAFDALQTLADLSLMMPSDIEDDSRMQSKDDDDDDDADDDDEHADELVPLGALMNQPKEKRRNSGIKMKGSGSEVAPSKTSRAGKASVNVSSVPEENQDLHQSISKTSRRKQKMPMSKIRKNEPQPDSQLSESTEVEAGDAGKSKNKKSLQSGSPNLKNSEKYSGADLRKEINDSAQSVDQVPVVNLPTKVRSRRKMHLKKPEVRKDLNIPDKISNEHCNLPFASLHDRAFSLKEKLSSCLENPRLRRWCAYEWFYSAIDYPWFAKREFVEYLYHVGLGHVPRLTRVEWGVIRSSLGKPRRFSEQFLKEEKEKLNQYRDSVRKHYSELRQGVREGLPTDLARPLTVGQRVIAIHPKTREIHGGSVLTVDHSRCRVQFDRHELGVEFVMDIDCMPLNPFENMPAMLGRQTIAVDKYFENLNEIKLNGRAQELMKLCPGDNVDNVDGISQLSPIAKPATYSHSSALAQIQAKEADVQALAELTRSLDKKEAVVLELRRLNDDMFETQKGGDSSLKESEPFKKHYAAVLVASALYCLRQRNTYQGNHPLAWPRPGTNSGDPGDGFSLNHPSSQTSEPVSHATEIIDSSRTKARAMVAAAMQAMSSLKSKDDTTYKIEEAVDYVNERLPIEDSSLPIKCTERQFPPSDVAQILDSAVTSLQPRSSQNLPVYTEIQKCMGIIRNQIMALIPT
ncbi:protein always early 3 [Phtheirospermum japonicum]|uniref:Protein always early 3 n=1 Tax=Phtheirospermum japonicum TaxID=374723 RepID=A0A830CY55_9LAMI|nr:protein always early 3 [Phtheirospermum japonicum]